MQHTRAIAILVQLAIALGSLWAAPARSQNGTWSALPGSSGDPSPRRQFAAIYDDEHQRYLLFAGFYGDHAGAYVLFNQVWTLSLAGVPAWSQVPIPGPTPGERHSPQWGYDAARHRLLVFGGYGRHYPGDPYAYLNDVWELSLDGVPQWTELFPTGTAPSGRLAGAAVYDPMRQRFVGFGGTVGVPVDTWVLNLHGLPVWQSLPIFDPRPNGGYGMTSVYDAAGDRMLIFGGSISDDYLGVHAEVWELRLRGLPRWNRITTSGDTPAARRSGTAIFDPLRNRMIIYGGWDSASDSPSSFLGDTWALSFEGLPHWTQLAPSGPLPIGRNATAAVYDPPSDRMVFFGGWNGVTMLGDTQFLSWSGLGVSASLTPRATASPGAAQLQWQVSDATSAYAAVYRRPADGEWTSLATAEVSVAGILTYEDTTALPDHAYDYMMVVASGRGETFGGEIAVQIPSALSVEGEGHTTFALHRVAPNPVVDRFTASFTLPGGAPATLELVDLAGRRWMDREVGALGAGTHHVALGGANRFPPGMYFLRLTQAERAATKRLVVADRF